MAKTPVATSGEGNSNSKLCWRLMAAKASKQIGPQTVASAGVAVRMRVAAWFALGTGGSLMAMGAWGTCGQRDCTLRLRNPLCQEPLISQAKRARYIVP